MPFNGVKHQQDSTMNNPNIAFIGAGNMAKSIIGGLLAEGFKPEQISASAPRLESLNSVASG
jgi:pyrroline-5-carboxylate reductase